MPASPKLPEPVAIEVAALLTALLAITTGEDRTAEASRALDSAIRNAKAEAATRQGFSSWSTFTASSASIIADRIRELRTTAGWTQQQLAESVRPYFPKWGRVTVAEIETATRRISFEELAMIAALFAVPIAAIMIPTDSTHLDLPKVDLSPDDLRELVVGRGGSVGEGGVDWDVAMQVASEPTPRPAPDYWTSAPSIEHEDPASRRRN